MNDFMGEELRKRGEWGKSLTFYDSILLEFLQKMYISFVKKFCFNKSTLSMFSGV